MPRKRGKTDHHRPNYYETSSPFETFRGGGKGEAAQGLVDSTDLPRHLMTGPSGPAFSGEMHPEQFDNPRGYPGLAIVTTGAEKAKIPLGKVEHAISPRTEKP